MRSNAAPIPGQWKLFLDETFVWKQRVVPQELYNLEDDPNEWYNLAGDAQYSEITRELDSKIPDDERFRYFARCGDFKVFVPADGSPVRL